jgi:hypothetical protein
LANSIFEDPADIRNSIRANLNKQKRQGETHLTKSEGLESMFDGDEIDDQLATKQDKVIAELDIPERLQLKLGR